MSDQQDKRAVISAPSSATDKGEGRFGVWRASILLLAGLVVTALIARYTKSEVDAAAKREFDFVCKEIRDKILDRLSAHEQILRSGASFFEHSDGITRKEWHHFTERQKAQRQLPGIQGIGFALLIPRPQLAQHVQEIRAEGFPKYRVWPEGQRETYSSIIHLEPFADRNLRAFGYDMLTEPVRREAMERARDQDTAALSGRVVLLQETDKDIQAGTLMYVPVYRKGMPCNTVAERRAAILGWVYSPYRMNDLMQGILGSSGLVGNNRIHLEVFDSEKASSETLLYDSQSAGGNELAPASALALQTPVDSAGRRWTLCFTQSGNLAAAVDYGRVWLVLLGGTGISLLLFGLGLSLLNTQFNAWRIAQKLTAEHKRAEEALRESEERHRAFFDQSRDAMMTMAAPLWRFTAGNPAALALFGVKTTNDFLALGAWDVSPERQPDGSPSVEKAQKMIEMALRQGSHFFEWTHKRLDGEAISCTVLLTRMSMAGKVVVQATVRDITEQKQAEAIRQEALDRLQKIASRVPGLVYQYRLRPDGSACLPFASEAIREIFRVSPEEVREDASKLFSNLHPDDYDGVFASIQKSGRDLIPWQHEFRVKYDDGAIRALYGNAVPQREEDGSVLWHGFITDITERKRAEEALREDRQRLAGIIKGTNVGTWEWNVQTGETIFNNRWAEIIGYTLEEISPVSIETWMKFSHPDDFKASNELLEKHFRGELDYYEFESRMKHKDGNWVWVLDRGKVATWMEDGKPLLMQGTHQDISERKELERRQALSTEVLSILNDHVALSDAIGHILTAIQQATGFDAVGIRLRNGDDFPYFSQCGFSADFLLAENSLIVRSQDGGPCRDKKGNISLECTCGLVISGQTDPASPLFTPRGSFWTNDSMPLLDLPIDQDPRLHPRNRCIHEGFCSVALIPIRANQKIVGLLQLNDRKKDCFTLEMVQFYEGVSESIGVALMRKQAEEDLLQAKAELEQYAVTLEFSNQALKDSNYAAEAANGAKSEFLANMSHEIRTPMTAILGYTEFMLEENVGRATQAHIEVIQRNGKHLLGLINDILDLSKIEAEKLQIEPIRCSPRELVAEVVTLMRVRADAKHLKLETDLAGPLPETVLTDPLRLRQILVNLLGNAIKFTEHGEVRLAVRMLPSKGTVPFSSDENRDSPPVAPFSSDENRDSPPVAPFSSDEELGQSSDLCLCFDVTDTGIGMSSEEIGKLFQPFTQVDNSIARKYGGTGLRLCISKRLSEALGGDIEVHSESGKGSTFRVTIDPGPLDGIRMIQNVQEAHKDLADRLGRHSCLPKADKNVCPTGPATQEKIALHGRILLAEDGEDNQIMICHLLRRAGAEVVSVENGQLALEQASAAWEHGIPFDVILMDMQMPVMGGYEATRQLRGRGYTGPIVALTAHSLVTDCQKCLDAGCDDYLPKPFEHRKLLEMAARYITVEKVDQLVYSPLADDPDYGELVDLFVQQIPERINALDAQAESRDWNQLAETAHKLKGAAGCYGFDEITPCAARLETLARESQQEQQILATLDELRSICHRVRSGKPQADEAPENTSVPVHRS